jgi:drug/metabolite transporter (DMT)-like permease
LLAVVLALGSAACYGVSNFLGPQLAKRHTLVAALMVGQAAALVGCLILLAVAREPVPEGHAVAIAALAGCGHAFGLIFFYRAAELGPLSIAAPIGATGAIVPVVWGLSTGDALHWWQAVGLVLALAGAVLASRSTPPPDEEGNEYPDPRLGAVFAACSAVAFGVFLTALPHASEDGRYWALLDARLALVLILVVWAGRRLAALRFGPATASLTLPGLLLLAGTLLYTLATEQGLLSLVSVLGSLFPLVTVGLGVVVLGERLSRMQAVGVTAALLGVVLIAA